MIEKFNFEEVDVAGIAGRATLIGGSAYGLHQTYKDMAAIPSATGAFRKGLAPMSAVPPMFNAPPNPIASTISMGQFMTEGLPTTAQAYFRDPIRTKKDLLNLIKKSGEGYRHRSAALGLEVGGLYDLMKDRFGSVRVYSYSGTKGARPDMLSLVGGGGQRFDIPIVGPDGTLTLGHKNRNSYIARSVLNSYGDGAVSLEGIDVALTRKYKDKIDDIAAGRLDAKDIKRLATDKAIWEETRGALDNAKSSSSTVSEVRKEQFIVDLFGEKTKDARLAVMKDISKVPGYSGGSASMFAKGVMATPDSLLSRGMPGAESTISSYQLFRMSQFEGARKPSINWTPELDAGLGEFTVASINDKESLKRAMKKVGMNLGELADEEMILSNKQNVGIKNKMYSFHIDLEREQTKFTQNLMRDIYEAAEAQGMDPRKVSKAMTSPGGLSGINLDLNKKLEILKTRETGLGREIDMLESLYSTAEMKGERGRELRRLKGQIRGKKAGLASVRDAISTYGVIGYDEMGNAIRVKGGDVSNLIDNIKIRNGQMSIATQSHYNFGVGSKVFTGGGGGKWTVKGVGNVAEILGWMEAEKMYGLNATAEQAKDLAKAFSGVDILSVEAPVKIKNGVLTPRESMTAIMSYASRIMSEGDPAAIKRLEQIGIKDGVFHGTNLTGKQLVDKIQGWHKGESVDSIFGGESFLSNRVSQMVMAPDISSTQAGVYGKATLSNRAAFNLQAMGLGDVLEDFLSRRTAEFSPFAQLGEIEAARNVASDTRARGKDLFDVADDLERVFQADLNARRGAMGGKEMLTINLGREIEGVDKVTVFASDVMSPYVGQSKAGMSPLDRATYDLLQSIKNGQDETFQIQKMKKYKAAFNETEEAISSNLFKGKIQGSVYGQAVSSLDGMDRAAKEMGKVMNLGDDMEAPLIAMTKADIRERFGAQAVDQASEGRLWGLMSREPIEGTHSSIPVNIRAADDFGVQGDMQGRIFVSGEDKAKSLIRNSMFVDFDKDTLHVIAATSDKSREAIEGFYGYKGKPKTMMGEEYLSSLKRMSAFDLKGRDAQSITTLLNNELVGLNTAQKNLEKGMIGEFSNEFKNIHIGLREQMAGAPGRETAKAFYLGEDFSHLFVENILKAKHQRKEALLAGSVEDALDLFRGSIGTEYAAMGLGERAQRLQEIFDDISFGGKEAGDMIRQSSGDMTLEAASKMGLADDLAQAARQRDAYKEITSLKNLENVMRAHESGTKVQSLGNYDTGIAKRMLSRVSGLKAVMRDVADSASVFMGKGLKNIGLWGILPTAGIGLAASLFIKPKMMQPALNTGSLHESEYEGSSAEMGKTLFSIPEQKVSSYDIKGTADHMTNFEALHQAAQSKMRGTDIRLQDHRSHMDKYTVKDLVEKGY
jgi:hypothetical protein